MGKPVALEARADEREVRGLISMTIIAVGHRVVGKLHVGAADDLDGLHNLIGLSPEGASCTSWEMVSMGAAQKESPV